MSNAAAQIPAMIVRRTGLPLRVGHVVGVLRALDDRVRRDGHLLTQRKGPRGEAEAAPALAPLGIPVLHGIVPSSLFF